MLLISPYWNVNIMCRSRITAIPATFNLSILECKSRQARSGYRSARTFNLSILECKLLCLLLCTLPVPLLISPYWNVNEIPTRTCRKIQGLLISPYWNVNRCDSGICNCSVTAFNLSILECKYTRYAGRDTTLRYF